MKIEGESMTAALLATKLYIPTMRHNLVPRPRLTAKLSECIAYPLTLISAPAGYGKTSLISEWRAGTGKSLPMSWLSLDTDDNDPVRFLTYLMGALEVPRPGQCQAAFALLQSPKPPPVQSVLTVLLNALGQSDQPFVLVLDDYHFVTSQPVHEILTFVLEHQPPQMHTVLLTRADPPLPLSRLRARNQLAEIRADHLRFTLDEIAIFLNEVMGLKLAGDDIAAMETRTEGWIAGLQLAALSMQGRQDVHSFVAAFTGSHYYIMDYLAEEVLKLQSERVRSFLLQTSVLDRLCGPLCDAVVTSPLPEEETEVKSGQAMLEALEQMNLFLIPLDGERHWYRYHHLFADVLNRRLERLFPQQFSDLHRRASQWYEQNGFIPEAIQQAMTAGDRDRAAQLVEQHGCALLIRGEVVTLLKWIEIVEFCPQAGPWVAIQKAWALLLTGRLDQVEPSLQTAEKRISALESSSEVGTMLGSVIAARAHRANLQGDTRLAADFARLALAQLPDSDSFSCSLRSVATLLLGDASQLNGNLEEARRAYTEAVLIGRAANDPQMVMIANSDLAGVLMELGQLRQAARTYSETLQMATRPDGHSSPLAEDIYAGLSRMSYEWNHLEAAAQYADQCIQLCRQWGDKSPQVTGYMMLARLGHAQGNPEKAQEAMRAVEQLASEYSLFPRLSIWVQSSLARLWLAQGDLERPSYLVQQSGITIDDDIPYLREPEYLILLRVLLAQGHHEAALALSARLLKLAEATNQMGKVIEILVFQALAFHAQKNIAQALPLLERAVLLSQPQGYVRLFLDEGEPMAKPLYQAKAHRIGGGYVAELLSATGKAAGVIQPPAQLLIEPLSARELEVFRLIEDGYANQEIAAKLFISLPTVKRHISNIYDKLGVQSRTQAVSLGRELKLFA
jgi:LuxR family maltose regulon positive regulatory protein